MLMERTLTIDNCVCGRWFLCLIALFLMSVGMQAENYGITVAGVEVTDANAGNITGANITAGTVSFEPQTSTLTLNNVSMNGNVVSSLAALNVKLVGVSTFNIDNSDGNRHYLFYSNNSSATLNFSADELGATLQGYGTTINYKLDLEYWFNVTYDNIDYWCSTTTQMDDKDYCQVSKPYVIVDGSAINDANKNNPDISGVSFDLTNNKVTLSGFQRDNQSYNSYSLITSNIANLNVDIQGGLNYIYLNTKKTNEEIASRGFVYTGASGQVSSLNVTVAEGSKLLLSWSGETATTNWLLEGFSQSNMALDKTKMQEAGVLAEAGVPYDFQMTISNYTPPVSYGITVAGVEVNSENASNITGDNITAGTVSFNPQTNILTLNNASISAYDAPIVSGLENLTVFLVGENSIFGGTPTFGKTSAVEEATITFTTDGESMGSLFINNLQQNLFGEGVTPVYSDVFIKHEGDSHTIDCLLGVRVGGVEVTSFNKDNVLGDGKVSYNAETHTLTLDNATISNDGSDPEPMETPGVYYSGTDDFTINLIGTNTINSCNCSAIRGGQTPKLIFTKAGEQPASLQMETTESSVIDGFSAVNHEGLFKIDERILGVDNTPDTYTVLVSSTLLGGGSGTAADPLLIKTTEDLTTFAYYICNGKISSDVSVKLYNDIDCEGLTNFAPIGYGNYFFAGTFDGNGKAIKNLTITDNAGDCVGLFRILGEHGMIKDLTIDNLSLSGGNSSSNNIGGLVGFLNGGAISNCILKNSKISCKTNSLSPTVGGLVGGLSSGSITDCTVQACTVKAVTQDNTNSGPVAQAGGIVGNAYGGTITGCQVKGATTVTADYGAYMATVSASAIVARKGEVTLSNNTYEYSVTTSTNKYDGETTHLTTKSGYEQRGIGGQTYNEQTQQNEDNPDLFDGNGAVMYTKIVTLPAESDQATVIGKEGTYYSTVMESDVLSILVAPGQTATLNAIPGEGLAIASLTVTNTTTSEAITTTATLIEDNEKQYTFTMPDAPVTVAVTAATCYGVTVGDVAVTELNYSDVLGDGKVSWDNTKHILTMNGATINGGIRCSIDETLTVHLVGENVIDGGYENANRNGARAFEGDSQNNSLVITTDTDLPGQLLLKGTFVNQWNNAEYYSNNMSPSLNNGLVASQNYSDKKMLIAQGPVVTPGEGLYWTNQQYTIPTGTQISCSDNTGQSVDVSVNANSFALTETGKYTVNISKAVTVDDTNFSLSNSGYYIVHNKPGFSDPAGTYTDSKTITLTNLPALSETSASYPQVWYYLDDNKNDSVPYTSVEQKIELTSSAKVCVYFLDEDSGKVVKSANVEAEYTILQTPDYHFSTSPAGTSYYTSGSKLSNLDYGESSNVLPWLINVPTGLSITYSTDDENVATISSTGDITLTGAGYVWISASNEATDVYAAHEERIRLEIRPSDPIISLEHGIYYTGQEVTMTPTVPNGTMYYRFGYNGDWIQYNEGDVITLPKGEIELYPFTRCGTEEQHMDSYGNGHVSYFVYDEPTISVASGTYNEAQQVTIGNLPTDGQGTVYYYFYDETLADEDANMVKYNANDVISVTESSILKVLIARVDTGKQIKTQPVEAQYVIRQDAGIAFASEAIDYTIGGENNPEMPSLSNENKVVVTYTSENEEVATVNAETGAVTIVGVGETTISATSAQTDVLLAGEASYLLTVYKTLSHESITVTVDDMTYTGEAVEPEVTVMDGETDITGYVTVAYSNNVAVGSSALVTITPKETEVVNYYVGSATQTFSIVNRTLEIGKDVNFASGQNWASFYTTTENLELPENVMAYIVTAVSTNTVTVKAINYVPKNVPVLIENESTATTDNTSAEGNLLQGTSESTAVSGINGNVYVLYNGGFTRATSGAIPSHRAYLVLEQEAGARLLIIEEETTGIADIRGMRSGVDACWYTLDGQKLQTQPTQKGMYIVNGQKVVIK